MKVIAKVNRKVSSQVKVKPIQKKKKTARSHYRQTIRPKKIQNESKSELALVASREFNIFKWFDSQKTMQQAFVKLTMTIMHESLL